MIIRGTHGIDYKFDVRTWEGLKIVGNVKVWNQTTQMVINKQSLSLFKRLVRNKAVNVLLFLNYLTEDQYKELTDWLNEI